MKTVSVTYTYDVEGWIDDTHVLTKCGKVINIKLGKEIKPQLRGSKAMYWISGKWQNDFKVDELKTKCPF